MTIAVKRLLGAFAAVVLVAAIVVAVSRHGGRADSAGARPSPATTVLLPPTTVATPLAPGTKAVTEPVDPAQIAVPDAWQTIPPEPRTLPGALRALEAGHPQMVAVLRLEEATATAGGIRLFAFTPSGPLTFVAVTSYAAPGYRLLHEKDVAVYPHLTTQSHGSVVDFEAIMLPVGGALRTRTVTTAKAVKTVGQIDLVPIAGRVVQLVMGTEGGAVPPEFADIEKSLRAG